MSFSKNYIEIYNKVEKEISLVNSYVKSYFECKSGQIEDELQKFLNSPSKHIRAVLSFLYLKACELETDERQIEYQAVIEIIHNASLIHDDVIDEALKRRNSKSFNANFGNHLSVIAGDYILATALKILADLNSAELLILISDTITKMCKGEISQEFSRFEIPTIEEYIEKTYNKTGSLFEATLCGANLIAVGNIDDNVRNFAKNIGIAFQIRDDILNVIQNNENSDIKNGIYTAPVIFSGNIQVSDSGIEKAKSLLNNYINNAKEDIKDISNNEYKMIIIKLLELINNE